MAMTEDEEELQRNIRNWIWSGYYQPDDVHYRLGGVLSGDEDEAALRGYVDDEFERREEAVASWPPETDCDRIDRVFKALTSERIVALQNAGYTTSDGHEDVADYVSKQAPGSFDGYCFFHFQDLERVIETGQLYLAFGDFADTTAGKVQVGKLVRDAFVGEGFACEWNESPDQRVLVTGIDWKRRPPRE